MNAILEIMFAQLVQLAIVLSAKEIWILVHYAKIPKNYKLMFAKMPVQMVIQCYYYFTLLGYCSTSKNICIT